MPRTIPTRMERESVIRPLWLREDDSTSGPWIQPVPRGSNSNQSHTTGLTTTSSPSARMLHGAGPRQEAAYSSRLIPTITWIPTRPSSSAGKKVSLTSCASFPSKKKKTAVDETFGYADFAVEVALLDRSLVIQGKEEIEDDLKTFGGHVIVLHTPMIEQHLEGALLTNMGQQGKLGKYPLHFHMSGNVEGSTLAKNVIWESNQRCIVIHGTHNVTIDSNVAFDNEGHCFVLEDGWERHNKFINNLGARTKSPSVLPGSRDEPRNVVGETDDFPATYWITNPTNHYIGNVAAGSSGPGFWFELKKRSPEKEFGTNINKNPRTGKLGTFANNTAHSNNFRAGFTTYHPGYTAPKGTVWTNTKSYKNKGNGLFFHGTQNIRVHGGLLADNNGAARNFGHAWAEYDGVTVIGRSAHVDQLVSQGRMAYQGCSRLGGLSIQPNQGQWKGATIKNCIFEGFDKGCTGGDSAIIWVEKDQVGEFDSAPIIYNNTVGPYDNPITACATEKAKVRYVAVEDRDGSLSNSGSPGFYVQNEEAVTNFLYESDCQEERECLRFCPNTCLRIGKVMISNDITTRGFKMYITDGGIMSDGSNRRAEILRGSFGPERSKVGNPHALMPFVLPAPKLGKYEITFKDRFGNPAWPGYAMIELERSPECGNLGEDFLKESHLELVIPESNERCKDLFYLDDYENEIFGWQDTFAGLEINQENETQSYFVSTNKRKKNGLSNVLILRAIDASCLKANPGRTYTLSGKIRITNADGNQVETDGTDMLSPMIVLHVNPSFTRTWRVATSADGWTEWSKDIQLPNDMSEAWEAFIVIKESSFNEFHVMDWSMELRNDLPPRMQDPIVQITNQETKHYLMVGDEGADFPFSGLDSTLLSPIKLQQDFCPTTGNYAEHELSSPCFLIVFEDFGANGRCMYARANGKWRQGLGLAASNKAADADHIWYLEQVECDSSENGCAIVRNAANGRSLYENNKFFRVGASPKGDQEWLWRDSHNWHFEIFGTDTELDLSLWASPAFTNRGE
mmetsp:Transcript_33357/g.49078  ORF Transcript_33357/g.49078 Transcript_33357/m.49078 type:complete len:1022 (-) Transcript_33357:371-3436(-)